MKDKLYSILIIIAGVFWGSMGLFVRTLSEYGLESMQITLIRLVSGAILLVAFALIYDKSLFKISLRDIPIFIAIGILSVLMMSWLYFSAIMKSTMSVAAILLYTAPIWVLIASVFFYGEKLTSKKVLALILAFGGCIAVSGFSAGDVSVSGILFGLGSGIAYALYSIIGKHVLSKYSPITVTVYSFAIAAVGVLFISRPTEALDIVIHNFDFALLMKIIGIGAVSVFVPYLLYTIGLSKTPAGKAAIMASVEPMTATVLGIAVYKEPLGIGGVVGIVMILSAIFILNSKNRV
ncbi:MAG: EamA family transporter [Clostridia bacterium]|nr:EamA family transporter [Clostridia bacterium]